MYLRQETHKYIIREETTVSMALELRFPLKRNHGFLYIGMPVSNFRNCGVKLPGILIVIALIAVGLVFNAGGVKDVLLELFNRIIGA